ncbi:hypothetical protein GCM10011571_29220 [Marinithermofilum abyssi]|uniref:Uncharacterized protein n=1 Tax=Marinithermofilum abyssi TaxID=1571185 RepID=A0A8J2VDB4_9BACL|nr:hypothetical protein GCM10011571_29220 [Marinithermofilum abyssi]
MPLEAADKVSRNERKNSFARAATFDDELSDKRGDVTKSDAPHIVPRLVESLGADSMTSASEEREQRAKESKL